MEKAAGRRSWLIVNETADHPTTNNGGMQNGSSVGTCTRCAHVFARLAPTRMLSRCLLAKIPASELSRKFMKSALLVGEKKSSERSSLKIDYLEERERGGGEIIPGSALVALCTTCNGGGGGGRRKS